MHGSFLGRSFWVHEFFPVISSTGLVIVVLLNSTSGSGDIEMDAG